MRRRRNRIDILRSSRRVKLREMNRMLVKQERMLTRSLRSVFRKWFVTVRKEYEADGELSYDILRETLSPMLYRAFVVHLKRTTERFGSYWSDGMKSRYVELNTKDFASIFEESVTAWIETYALDKATSISSSAIKRIREVVLQGQRDGLGTVEIAKQIRSKVGDEYEQWRAERIARTETHTAANRGTHDAAKATGLELKKVWLAAEDARVRPSHSAADGQEVGVDEPFRVGASVLQYPGDPAGPAKEIINCRCVVSYEPQV